MTIRSGFTRSITSTASDPDAAVSTSKPAKCKDATKSSRIDGSSSTTTIDASTFLLILISITYEAECFLNKY